MIPLLPFYLFYKNLCRFRKKARLIFLTDGRFIYPYGYFRRLFQNPFKYYKKMYKYFKVIWDVDLPEPNVDFFYGRKNFKMKEFSLRMREKFQFYYHTFFDDFAYILNTTVKFRDVHQKASVFQMYYEQVYYISQNYFTFEEIYQRIVDDILQFQPDDLQKYIIRKKLTKILFTHSDEYKLYIPYDLKKIFYQRDYALKVIDRFKKYLNVEGYDVQALRASEGSV